MATKRKLTAHLTLLTVITLLLCMLLNSCSDSITEPIDTASSQISSSESEPSSEPEPSTSSEADESSVPDEPPIPEIKLPSEVLSDTNLRIAEIDFANQAGTVNTVPYESGFYVFEWAWGEGNALCWRYDFYAGELSGPFELAQTTVSKESVVPFDGGIGVCDYNGNYCIYNSEMQLVKKLELPYEAYRTCVSVDGGYVYYSDTFGLRVYRMKVETGEAEVVYDSDFIANITYISLTDNDKQLVLQGINAREATSYTVFVDIETGKEVYSIADANFDLDCDKDSLFMINRPSGFAGNVMIYDSETPNLGKQLLLSGETDWFEFSAAPGQRSFITSSKIGEDYDTETTLRCYDTESGTMKARLVLKSETHNRSYVISDGSLSLDGSILCFPCYEYESEELINQVPENILVFWDISAEEEPTNEERTNPFYGGTEFNRDDVVDESISEALRQKRDELEKKFGIFIFMGYEITRTYGEYDVKVETDEDLIENALNVFDKALAKYPNGFFNSFKDDSIKSVCFYLAGSLTSDDEYSLSAAGAFATRTGSEQMFVFDITPKDYVEQCVYHEIAHGMDSVIDGCDEADLSDMKWNTFNPTGFEYAYDYNTDDVSMKYTSGYETRTNRIYFVDTYAKRFPTEDRARLMEYLMTFDDQTMFKSDKMRAKLKYYFECVRLAFDSENWGVTSWEAALAEYEAA